MLNKYITDSKIKDDIYDIIDGIREADMFRISFSRGDTDDARSHYQFNYKENDFSDSIEFVIYQYSEHNIPMSINKYGYKKLIKELRDFSDKVANRIEDFIKKFKINVDLKRLAANIIEFLNSSEDELENEFGLEVIISEFLMTTIDHDLRGIQYDIIQELKKKIIT